MNRALIFGITGQDGALLAEFLLNKGYEVHGVKRTSSSINTDRLNHLYKDRHEDNVRLHLHYGDLTDPLRIFQIIDSVRPNEVYNLAAQSHVHISFEMPDYTANVDALGALRILEVLRSHKSMVATRFLQAGTSEMFGRVLETPQNELTPFNPQSPYAISKVFAHYMTINYRLAYGLYAANSICFNHESPTRGENFITKKVVKGLVSIRNGDQKTLYIGNLDSKRDWGYAGDYVEAMWLILQQKIPNDFVIATGIQKTVKELIIEVASKLEMQIEWRGEGISQYVQWLNPSQAYKNNWQVSRPTIIKVDPEYYRPAEVDSLLGDSSKAREILNWQPKVNFEKLVEIMCLAEVNQSIL
jgi:GDPmannose 4,6-dehydratase